MQRTLPIFKEDDEEFLLEYNTIHRNKSTFKSGLSREIHHWFRLTPSFGPDLIKIILEEFNYNNKSIVLDPFAGAGTTLIECKILGIKSYGFEINPFLYFVGNTSLSWDLSFHVLENCSQKIEALFNKNKKLLAGIELEETPYKIPPIHNVFRWWRKDVLKDLLILKYSIIECSKDLEEIYRNFFYLCLSGVLVPNLTNVTLGKLQLHFIDRETDEIDVFHTFKEHLLSMLKDYKKISELGDAAKSIIYNLDSTDLSNVSIKDKINFVITSPPYPNRYSYVWNTRPFLYLFDFILEPIEASNLDKKCIGGTWGTATSILAKGIVQPLNKIVDEFVTPVSDEIRKCDNLMANYVVKYFNLLTKQIIEMDGLLDGKAKVAYVVGNSRIKNVNVETDKILSRIFTNLKIGYKKSKINRFRKRNSGVKLYESIVYCEK